MYAAGNRPRQRDPDAILTLLRHPDQLALLQDDWSLLDTAVNRAAAGFDGPGLATSRLFPEDVEIGGHESREHPPVLPVHGRRQPDRATSRIPTASTSTRENAKDHLGFGTGLHAGRPHLAKAIDRRRRPVLFSRLQNPPSSATPSGASTRCSSGPKRLHLAWDA